jgi:hypothetical protein
MIHQRNLIHRHTAGQTGHSTYLALIFGTLLSSQGTEASIKTEPPVSPGFPFVLFSSLSDLFRPDSRWWDSALPSRPLGRSDE